MNSFFFLLLFTFFFAPKEREGKNEFYGDSVGEQTKITVEPVFFFFFVCFSKIIGLTMSMVPVFYYFCGRTTAARGMSEETCLCRRRSASI